MTSAASLSADARAEVRRIVIVSRFAGLAVAVALGLLSYFLNKGAPLASTALSGYASVALGTIAFIAISTLARIGHARVLERSIDEVRTLTDQLREMADKDPLTGLANMRAFSAAFSTALAAAEGASEPVSLVVADLDNFKLLNDSFGHQFGDEVLRGTGRVFFACGGPLAVAARLGGDEFALLLPRIERDGAVQVVRRIEASLRGLNFDGNEAAPLGSFGIATYPTDGTNVQALFAAADGRMYSEKHRRKSESLSSLAGASRKLFVRAGRAMRPDRTTSQMLQEIVTAAREEFSLSLCAIAVQQAGHHAPIVVTSADSVERQAACMEAGGRGALTTAVIAPMLPGEMWLLETPIRDESGVAGTMLLAGLPTASHRPDTPVVVALADLVQAVAANGRARVDAVRAGRERDIHVNLAHTLAGEGSLASRLDEVARSIAEFTRASTVTVHRVDQRGGFATYGGGATYDTALQREWQDARDGGPWFDYLRRMSAQPPTVIEEIALDAELPVTQRQLLERAGVRTAALVPVRFDGQALALLTAVSATPGFFGDDLLAVLTTIADHLAPAINVALLREALEASARRLEQTSRESLARLADAAEARDPHTSGHLRRIRHYTVALAEELGLTPAECHAIGAASAIHDLGKLKLPDSLLLKPGRLAAEDWDIIREHPAQGERLIGDSPQFETERAVARWHHERWDGSGYPDGLRGEAIPLPARIVAVADAFDALTTKRPYKPAWSVDDAYAEVQRVRGSVFCPTVSAALEAIWRRGELAALYEAASAEDAHHNHDAGTRQDLAA